METIKEIKGDEFTNHWEEDHNRTTQERLPEPEDSNSRARLEEHKQDMGRTFKYYWVELGIEDIKRLLLPYHDHTIKVPPEGMTVIEYGEKYAMKIYSADESGTDCLRRIRRAIKWFEEPEKSNPLFMWISDNKDIAMQGHFNGRDNKFLFAGSSHKFAAYAAWIKRNGFKVLSAYFVAKK